MPLKPQSMFQQAPPQNVETPSNAAIGTVADPTVGNEIINMAGVYTDLQQQPVQQVQQTQQQANVDPTFVVSPNAHQHLTGQQGAVAQGQNAPSVVEQQAAPVQPTDGITEYYQQIAQGNVATPVQPATHQGVSTPENTPGAPGITSGFDQSTATPGVQQVQILPQPPPIDPTTGVQVDPQFQQMQAQMASMQNLMSQVLENQAQATPQEGPQQQYSNPQQLQLPEGLEIVSKADVEALKENPDLLNQFLLRTFAMSNEHLTRSIPKMVTQQTQQQVAQASAISNFFASNPDLNPHRARVAQIADTIRGRSPGISLQDLLTVTEMQVRAQLGLQKQAVDINNAVQQGQSVPQQAVPQQPLQNFQVAQQPQQNFLPSPQPAQQPVVMAPAPAGGPRVGVSSQAENRTPVQIELDHMMNGLPRN